MKKYVTLSLILLSAVILPAYSASAASQSEVSIAEDMPERDPMEYSKPVPNENASTISEPSSQVESASPSDYDTPMIFQRGECGSGDVEDIIAYWEKNGYPENLSFIAETGSEMIDGEVYTNYDVGLVNASEEKCEEILDIAGSNNVLRFTTGANALWERELYFEKLCYLSVQEEDIGILEVQFHKNSDMITVVVSGSEKTYYDRFSKQFGGVATFVNERNVATDNTGFVPGNSENKIANYIEKLSHAEVFHADIFLADNPGFRNGAHDIIEGMYPDGFTTIGNGDQEMGSSPIGNITAIPEQAVDKSVPLWVIFAAGAAALILAAIAALKLRVRFKAGTNGTAAAHRGAEDKIISAIKSAEEQPDPRLLEKIKDNIAK